MHDEDQVPIWLFIGGILLLYGVLIFAAGLYAVLSPPPPEQRVALFHLHADVWWGLFMASVGAFYVYRFRPRDVARDRPSGSDGGVGAAPGSRARSG